MKRDKIREMYKACSKEITSRTNDIQHLLLGEGDFDAKVMIIAEVPSAKEEDANQNILDIDREQLLKMLKLLGLTLEEVYITYLMKYRPYKFSTKGHIVSRKPSEEEFSFFMPYLEKEISLVGPKLIITLGEEPLRRLSKDVSIKINPSEDQLLVVGVHGKSYKLFPMFHPSENKFETSIESFKERDAARIIDILKGGQMSNAMLQELKNQISVAKVSSMKEQEMLGTVNNNRVEDNSNIGALSNIGVLHQDVEKNKLAEDSLSVMEEPEKKRLFEKIKLSGKQKNKNKRSYITMIYGGEGFVDDPVLIALERISRVFTELEIGIHRIDLYKGKVSMAKAFEYISESKGVVLGVCIEWFGIGYRMQQFLDECFYNGDKSYFDQVPLLGVTITRQAFEKDAYMHLLKSWQCLGGREGNSIEGIVKTASELETNFDWLFGIDKKAEQYYRVMQQDKGLLPISHNIERIEIEVPIEGKMIQPNYSHQISEKKEPVISEKDSVIIEDYNSFVEKQEKDIQSISSIFKKKMSTQQSDSKKELPQIIMEAYQGSEHVKAMIQILFEDVPRENTVVELNGKHIRSYFGQKGEVELSLSSSKEIYNRIFSGKLTMQRAFMTGEVKAKGDFTLIYKFEEYFKFHK